MTVAFSTSTTGTLSSGLTVPAGGSVGDIEIIVDCDGTRGVTWSWSNDFVQLQTDSDTTSVWARRRTASSPDTVTFTPSTSGGSEFAWCGRFTGATQWVSAMNIAAGTSSVDSPVVDAPTDGYVVWLTTGIGGFSSFSGYTGTLLGTNNTPLDGWRICGESVSAGATPTRSQAVTGGAGYLVGVTVALGTNRPPNTATWSSPADGVSLDRTVDQVLNYVFSDPDAGDSQSERQWRYSTDGGSTWTTTTDVTTSTSITIAGSTFANGDTVQVQVKPADSTGTYALSWSASLHVTFEDPPSPPTITAPTSGATIGSSTQTVTFSAPSLTQYKYRVVGDSSGSPDTGTVYVPETTVTDASSRSFTVTGLPNSVTVHLEVNIYTGGLWSGWSDQANPVSYDPPPTPTVTVTPGTATITVTVATAAPGTGEVAAESVTVENSTDGAAPGDWSRSGQAINGDVIYRLPVSGQAYQFRATAVAASGVTAASAWTS